MQKQKPNFKCNDCGYKFYLQQYTITASGKLKDKNGVPIKCENPLMKIIRPVCLTGFTFIAPRKGVPELMGVLNGTFVSEKILLKDKQKKLDIRSKHHFKNEILPNHPDPQMKPYFEKKYKGTKFKDHEKIK